MNTANINTPYDDVFRTLLADCSRLILPVVNEVFHETYTGTETLHFFPNEQFHILMDGTEEKRVTDTHFSVTRDSVSRYYHIECQSTEDSSILVRIFEYDSHIAIRNSERTRQELIVSFPNSALLALRHTSRTPDAMKVTIRTAGGSVHYDIPVIKISRYPIDILFSRKLYVLIPFHIFTFEKDLNAIETDPEQLKRLKQHYADITERLEALCRQGELTDYEKRILLTLSENIINALAKNYEQIRKGVGSIMGGQILDYEAKRIWKSGVIEGRAEGRIEERFAFYLKLRRNGFSIQNAQDLTTLTDEQVTQAEERLSKTPDSK